MAYEIPGFSFTLEAGEDFSTGKGQFRFVKVDTDGACVTAGDGDFAIGVRQNTPALGVATTVVASGISMVEVGAEVAIGDFVTADADGRAIPAVLGDVVHGQALEGAAVAGHVATVFLFTSNVVPA